MLIGSELSVNSEGWERSQYITILDGVRNMWPCVILQQDTHLFCSSMLSKKFETFDASNHNTITQL